MYMYIYIYTFPVKFAVLVHFILYDKFYYPHYIALSHFVKCLIIFEGLQKNVCPCIYSVYMTLLADILISEFFYSLILVSALVPKI